MKHRSTQLAARKNPDSPRVHGLRLSVNSQSFGSFDDLESSRETQQVLSPRKAHTIPSAPPGSQNGATVGREPETSQLLTVGEVAALLRVPVSWVYGRMRRRSRERLPGYRLGKYWRFNEAEVRAWLKCHRGVEHVS